MSQSLSSKLQVITHNRFVIIHNKPVIQNKKPPETISFPAALSVSFHGIGTVCCKADILPEVINDIFAKENSGERQLGICFPRQIQIAIALLVSDGKRGYPFLCRIPRHLRHIVLLPLDVAILQTYALSSLDLTYHAPGFITVRNFQSRLHPSILLSCIIHIPHISPR
jgi:hypothetical protein